MQKPPFQCAFSISV